MANAEEIKNFEQQMDKLHVAYEKYFIGAEKKPPSEDRARLNAQFIRMTDSMTTRTSDKFMLENIRQKWGSYRMYWDRTLREIEEGTYRRHIQRDQLRKKLNDEFEEIEKASKKGGGTGAFDLSQGVESGVKKPAAPAKPAAGAAAARPYEDVFTAYRKAGQNVSYDKLQESLAKQEAQLKQKFGAKRIDFKVVVEDGKPKIKATPVK